MRGFLVGSLGLIVLYVALQPNSASTVEKGSNVLTALLRRGLSADVAGIPARKKMG